MSETTAAASAAGPRPKFGWPSKLGYGFGQFATAIEQRTMAMFMLIFYNQVVGLSPAVASTIIMLTVIFDAVVDPTVGQVSDNFRSRLGRRHPFMYAAAIPFALLFFALWNPPQAWSQSWVVIYFTVVLLGLRFFDTFFELPAVSLLPELTDDYDERSRLAAIRHFFYLVGGTGALIVAYQVFLKENPDGTGGVLARDGYFTFSLVGAALIFVAIIVCALSTHRQIPYLIQAPAKTPGIGEMMRSMGGAIGNPSFMAVAGAAMLGAVGVGLKGALDLYWFLYMFQLPQTQIALLQTFGLAGGVIGVALTPIVVRRLGKKAAAMTMFLASIVLTVGPIGLWMIDLLPAAGSTSLFVLLAADQFLNSGVWSTINIASVAMIADIVEDVEVRTGRRSEGLLFSAVNLFRKAVAGLGVFGAGMVLTFAAFPRGATRQNVTDDMLTKLASAYVPAVIVVYAVAAAALYFHRIDRARHEANLAKLGRGPGG